jgi:FdhD protein
MTLGTIARKESRQRLLVAKRAAGVPRNWLATGYWLLATGYWLLATGDPDLPGTRVELSFAQHLERQDDFCYMEFAGIRDFGIRRYSAEARFDTDLDQLAVEEPLEIILCFRRRGMLVRKPISITMRTPGQDQELAVGFLYTEGILHRRSDIGAIERGPDSSISVTVAGDVDLSRLERHFYTSSSCGVCGKTSLQALRMNREVHLDRFRPKHAVEFLLRTPSLVREKQPIFEHTGGLHGAALFDPERNLLRICEDIGRHNAVDKLVGAELLGGRSDFSDLLLFVSGRAGFELVQKSIMTGIPFMVAVGAPSSLSVELAREYGSTLVGFLREGRFNLYAGSDRVGRF